jgi:protocatechuate 3,4-dioxygenase beta subunit
LERRYELLGFLLFLLAVTVSQQLPGATVEGVVVDAATGSPLKGVRVLARGRGESAYRPATTDDGGRFTFNNLPSGNVMMLVSREGYLGTNLSQQVAPTGRYSRQVELTRSAAVSGRVYDVNRRPAPRVIVQLLREEYDVIGQRSLVPAQTGEAVIRTDDKGEYHITGIAPADYYIRATYAAESARRTIGALVVTANNSAATYYPGVTSPEEALPVKVTGGANLQAIDFSIEPQSAFKISGRIINPFLQSDIDRYSYFLVRRNVRLNDGNGLVADTDPDIERFELRNVPRGSYDLYVGFRSGPSFEDSYYTGRASLDVVDRDITDLTITIDAGVDVSGIWNSDDAGATEPGIRVPLILRPVDGMPQLLAPISADDADRIFKMDSKFEVPHIARGRYVLSFNLPENVYVSAARLGAQDILGRPFDVDSHSTGTLVIETNSFGGMIEGTVNDGAGKPIAGAQVILVPPLNFRTDQFSYKSASTDAQGRFSIVGIRPGRYSAFAFAEKIRSNAAMNSEFMTPYLAVGVELEIGEAQQLHSDLIAIPKR